jgi:hypothetical protein
LLVTNPFGCRCPSISPTPRLHLSLIEKKKGTYLIVFDCFTLTKRLSPTLLPWLHPGPVALPVPLVEHVNEPQSEGELARLQAAVRRGCPFGADGWVREAAGRLRWESTLWPRGRPRKARPTATPTGETGLF